MAHVKPGVVILPIILTQDETTQDNGGRRMLKPMYAQFGTLRVGQRNQKWGRVCVGFLPLPNKNHRPQGMAKEEWQRQKRAIFQNAMDIMLADVRRYEDTGVVMQLRGRDGKLRSVTVVPVVAMYPNDQPENAKIINKKDAYRNMAMFCTMCARWRACSLSAETPSQDVYNLG